MLAFGNGGSAADATHLAAELVGRFLGERRALPALSLSDNASAVTAIGNDYGYERVFARQVEAHGAPGDVAIGISTSGRSPNVLDGLAAARARRPGHDRADAAPTPDPLAAARRRLHRRPVRRHAAHPGGAHARRPHPVRAGRARIALSAVFLDRDGVVNRKAPEGEYVALVGRSSRSCPGALEGLRALAGLERARRRRHEPARDRARAATPRPTSPTCTRGCAPRSRTPAGASTPSTTARTSAGRATAASRAPACSSRRRASWASTWPRSA